MGIPSNFHRPRATFFCVARWHWNCFEAPGWETEAVRDSCEPPFLLGKSWDMLILFHHIDPCLYPYFNCLQSWIECWRIVAMSIHLIGICVLFYVLLLGKLEVFTMLLEVQLWSWFGNGSKPRSSLHVFFSIHWRSINSKIKDLQLTISTIFGGDQMDHFRSSLFASMDIHLPEPRGDERSFRSKQVGLWLWLGLEFSQSSTVGLLVYGWEWSVATIDEQREIEHLTKKTPPLTQHEPRRHPLKAQPGLGLTQKAQEMWCYLSKRTRKLSTPKMTARRTN